MGNSIEKILVIKLSALGDFIQALGAMASIRKHHPNADITLLTTMPFKLFAEECGYFNDIWIDEKPKVSNPFNILSLRKKLISSNFSRVYDLQNNDRTCLYFKLFSKRNKPEWVGIAKGASHRNTSSKRIAGHAFDGHKQTLSMAGIKNIEIDNLKWIKEDISAFDLKLPYIIFAPSCSEQHPQKRWSKEKYGELACLLTSKGYQIVLLGTNTDKNITKKINSICPEALDLTGKTSLFQIATLAHNAAGSVGNDTGPMHIIGATGCPCLIIFSSSSDPIRHTPKGSNVSILQKDNLERLEANTVFDAITNLLQP